MNYKTNLMHVSLFPKYYLGQEIGTPQGKGIIIGLEMPSNGLYISPEKTQITVWFGMDRVQRWVQVSYSISEIEEYKNLKKESTCG